MKLKDIAEFISGKTEGDSEKEVTGVGKIETADENEITFISNPLYVKFFKTTKACAVIVSNDFETKVARNDVTLVRVEDPYLSFLKLLEKFEETKAEAQTGISELSYVCKDSELGENVYTGTYVSIGSNCKVGKNTKIFSNCSIEKNTVIGDNCTIYPNVTLYKETIIGNNVIIHSGTVIGSDGFGFVKQEDGTYKKIPQTGKVVIEDNVEIGSNCSIDRATIGETKICKGVKIDNQIQIAHNVFIDENTVIAAQVGIAGSTKIGKRCMIGGQSGIVGHITICDDVIIGAAVGVPKSIDKPGLYTGYRARPLKETLRMEVGMQNLRKLEDRVKELEKKLSNQK